MRTVYQTCAHIRWAVHRDEGRGSSLMRGITGTEARPRVGHSRDLGVCIATACRRAQLGPESKALAK
jgi:hypothetical protein